MGEILAATDKSIAAAEHLTDMDAGVVAAMRIVALKLDHIADQQAGVSADGDLVEEKRRAGFDNVTLPTFLKYCTELGLTPMGRKLLWEKKAAAEAAAQKPVKPEDPLAKRRANAAKIRAVS